MAGERLKMGVVGADAFASRRHLPRLKERDDVVRVLAYGSAREERRIDL